MYSKHVSIGISLFRNPRCTLSHERQVREIELWIQVDLQNLDMFHHVRDCFMSVSVWPHAHTYPLRYVILSTEENSENEDHLCHNDHQYG